jgi:TolC family type I secretion outer membrane protein
MAAGVSGAVQWLLHGARVRLGVAAGKLKATGSMLGEGAVAVGDSIGKALNPLGVGPLMADPTPTVLPAAAGVLDASRPLGLMQAWRAAQANDPSLRAAQAAAAAGRERVPQAQSQLLPSIQLGASRFRNFSDRESQDFLGQAQTISERYFSDNTTLSFRQPLFRQQQQAALRQSRHLVQEVEASLQRERQNLAVKVAGAYFETMLARDQVGLVASQKTFLLAQMDAAQKSFERGTGTRTDVDETRARLDLNRAQELEALQQVDLARRQLQSLVNRPFGEIARLDPQRLSLAPPTPASVDEWIARALESSPEILAIKAQRLAAREEIVKARAGHLPTLDLVAQVQRSRSENANSPQTGYTNNSIGLQFNMPLFSGGYQTSVERQTLAEHERLGELLEALQLDLGVRVHREFRGVTEGISRIHALEVAVRSADVAVDSARKSFTAGTRTTLDVLNAEQQRVQVLRDLAQARYMTLMSMVRLQALTGGVDETSMALVAAATEP